MSDEQLTIYHAMAERFARKAEKRSTRRQRRNEKKKRQL